MFIYSEKIVRFIAEVKFIAKKILSEEVGLKVTNDYFYNFKKDVAYRLSIVIYNHKSMLGYFDPTFYELGFHERLMHVSQKQLHDIIRHELAHFITYITHKNLNEPHGPEFRAFCRSVGWGEDVYKATTCLESDEPSFKIEESDIFRKVQKLLALATSSNQNEAEQAMIKSRQLLLKHNIDSKYVGKEDEEQVILKRILRQNKQDTKMRAIAKILETFFVSSVYHRGQDGIYLEILGNKVNVEIAEYVAEVLLQKLDDLWGQTKLEYELKGVVAKNSFFLGLAKGYCDKIGFLKKSYEDDVKGALVIIEKKLSEAKSLAYPRLGSSKSQGGYCHESSKLGEKAGKELTINPALSRSAKHSNAYITYDR